MARMRSRSRLAAAAWTFVCLAPLVSACGLMQGFTTVGRLGVSVDEDGEPVVAVMTCSEVRPVITMFDDGDKVATDPESEQHIERGRWVAGAGFAGARRLSISTPDQTWDVTRSPGALEPGRLFALEGFDVEDEFASVGGASFRIEDLAALTPDLVQVNGSVVSWSTFGAYRCSNDREP